MWNGNSKANLTYAPETMPSTDRRTDGRTDGRTDKVNPVYPPSNFVGRGYNYTNLQRVHHAIANHTRINHNHLYSIFHTGRASHTLESRNKNVILRMAMLNSKYITVHTRMTSWHGNTFLISAIIGGGIHGTQSPSELAGELRGLNTRVTSL